MPRALIVCPGRGSYDRSGLGQLSGRGTRVVPACDAYRRAHDRTPVSELDGQSSYKSSLHVAGENASLLTFACGMADLEDLRDTYEIVGVTGNSMGFYTALAVSGALSLEDAIRLVDTMGAYQKRNVIGGQVLYPLTGPTWSNTLVEAEREAQIEETLAAAGGFWSIRLGPFAVLGADKAGCKQLLKQLPADTRGARQFPAQLPFHSAFHTPLMAETSVRALEELSDLNWKAPEIPLVDGHGVVHRPRWADTDALRRYTLGAQVTEPYDYTLALRTALHHCAPDVVILLGPGNSLGGPTARILLAEGWRGMQTRDDLDQVQSSEPLLLSFGVRLQRDKLT